MGGENIRERTEREAEDCKKNVRPSSLKHPVEEKEDLFDVGDEIDTLIGNVKIVENKDGMVVVTDGTSDVNVAMTLDDFLKLSPVHAGEQRTSEGKKDIDELLDSSNIENDIEEEIRNAAIESGLTVGAGEKEEKVLGEDSLNAIKNLGSIVGEKEEKEGVDEEGKGEEGKGEEEKTESDEEKKNESTNECTQASAIAPVFGGFRATYRDRKDGIVNILGSNAEDFAKKCASARKKKTFEKFVTVEVVRKSKNEGVDSETKEAVQEFKNVDSETASSVEKFNDIGTGTADAVEEFNASEMEQDDGTISVERIGGNMTERDEIKKMIKDAIKEAVAEINDGALKKEKEESSGEDDGDEMETETLGLDDLEDEEIEENEGLESEEENGEEPYENEESKDENVASGEEGNDESDEIEEEGEEGEEEEEEEPDFESIDMEEEEPEEFDESVETEEKEEDENEDIDEEVFDRFKDALSDVIKNMISKAVEKQEDNSIDERRKIPEE